MDDTASPNDTDRALAEALGRALLSFGSIEGYVNRSLDRAMGHRLLNEHVYRLGITKRLDLLSALLCEKLPDEAAGLKAIFDGAKALFVKRRMLTNNPVALRGGPGAQESVIQVVRYQEGAPGRGELTREDVEGIAAEAEEVHVQMRRVYFAIVL